MTSILVKAAKEFLGDERKRVKRPRFTPEERERLEGQLNLLAQNGLDVESSAFRGTVAVDLLNYGSDFEDNAVNVIADIMHALNKAGENPLMAIAHARAEYMRDLGEDALEATDEEEN